jgi:hypothetical protein
MARCRSSPRSVERPFSNRMKRLFSPARAEVATTSSSLADGCASVPVCQVDVRTTSERTPRRLRREVSGRLAITVCRPAGKCSARTGACTTCAPLGRTAAAAAQGRRESIVPVRDATCAPASGRCIALRIAATPRSRKEFTSTTGLAGGDPAARRPRAPGWPWPATPPCRSAPVRRRSLPTGCASPRRSWAPGWLTRSCPAFG